jgi:hypothetical protein
MMQQKPLSSSYKVALFSLVTIAKSRNTKNVISVLSSDYYNKNYHFQAEFSIIAYVFVFSIVTDYIGICLFPSITLPSNLTLTAYTN